MPLSACLQLTAYVLVTCASLVAQAAEAPPVVQRKDWGATEPASSISTYASYNLAKPVYDTIVLHSTFMGHGTGAEEARRIQRKELELGFSDIAYNFLIDSGGTIYEGRYLWHVPSHAGQSQEANLRKDIRLDPDFGAIGIAFSSGPDSPINQKQIDAAYRLIAFFKEHRGFNIQTVMTHAEVKGALEEKHLTPVGKYDPHECPGTNNMETMIRLRRALREKYGILFDEQKFRSLFSRPSAASVPNGAVIQQEAGGPAD